MQIKIVTAAQAAKMPEWVNKWLEIGLSTAPADFNAATEAALRAYKLCNLERPTIILRMGSPYSATLGGIIAHAMLRELAKHGAVRQQVWQQVGQQVGQQVEQQVRQQVEQQVWQQVGQQVGQQVEQQVRQQVGQQVEQQVGRQVRQQVEQQVEQQVRQQVGRQVRQQVEQQVEQQVWQQVGQQVGQQVEQQVEQQVWQQVGQQVERIFVNDIYGNRGGAFWASWCAYIGFIRDVLGWSDPVLKRFEIDEQLTRSCGWVWWHENVLAISDRPSILQRDEQGRLHSEAGPSIAYRDGWALHHWHGTQVPDYVIERPSEITVQRIESERNAEVRRVMISRYGQGRFLLDSGADLVNRDDCGILYRKPVAGDEPIVMVRVLNPTPEHDGTLSEAEARAIFGDVMVERNITAMQRLGFALRGSRPKFKEYMLRVPPGMRTAREAVAWTFGREARAWKPALET